MKTSFNGGMLSPLMAGRTDVSIYANGYKDGLNILSKSQGALTNRPGCKKVYVTENVGELKSWVVPFQFSDNDAFILEMYINDTGTTHVNFYKNYARVLTDEEVPYSITLPYTESALNNEDGTFGLSIVESNDVLYIDSGDFPPAKLQRFGDNNWVYQPTSNVLPVDLSLTNDTDVELTYSVADNFISFSDTDLDNYVRQVLTAHNVTLGVYINNNDITINQWEANKGVSINDYRQNGNNAYKALTNGTTGYLDPIHTIGIKSDGNAGVRWEYQNSSYNNYTLILEGAIGAQTILAADLTKENSANCLIATAGATSVSTKNWVLSDWRPRNISVGSYTGLGYPDKICIFKNRAVHARTSSDGIKMYFSKPDDYENFNVVVYGTQTEDSAIILYIESNKVNKLSYMFPTEQGLIIGTESNELLITEQTTSKPFSYDNYVIKQLRGYGAKAIPAIQVNDSIVYVQAYGRKIRDFQYNFNLDSFDGSVDLTRFAENITESGIIQIAYQKEPDSTIWALRADGVLLSCQYIKAEQIIAWNKHQIAGTFEGGNAIVESISVIPNPTLSQDDLWLIVKRTVNGETVRTVEYMSKEFHYITSKDLADAVYMDSAVTYEGSAITTITGLEHLEGEDVSVLADGILVKNKVVTDGEITLPQAASKVHVGLGYESYVQTLRLEANLGRGTLQTKVKNINKLWMRLYNTNSLKAGATKETTLPLDFRFNTNTINAPVPLFTGDKDIVFNGGSNTDGYIWVLQNLPLPFYLLALMIEVSVEN